MKLTRLGSSGTMVDEKNLLIKVMVHYCMKPEHDILLQCVLNIAEMFGFDMGGMWKCCLEQNSVIFQF